MDGEDRFCHLKPPTALMKVDGAPYFTFPFVKPNWWCGEWKIKT